MTRVKYCPLLVPIMGKLTLTPLPEETKQEISSLFNDVNVRLEEYSDAGRGVPALPYGACRITEYYMLSVQERLQNVDCCIRYSFIVSTGFLYIFDFDRISYCPGLLL